MPSLTMSTTLNDDMCDTARAAHGTPYVARVIRFRDAVTTRPTLDPPAAWRIGENGELSAHWRIGPHQWTIVFTDTGPGFYVLYRDERRKYSLQTAAETINMLEDIHTWLEETT